MKLSKEKIIEAAEAFNRAKSFDEFKVLLDLCDVKLEDFEQDYFEIASATHPVFANMISGFGKYKTFNSRLYMKLDLRKIPGIAYLGLLSRFKLPVWFEKDEFGMVKVMMPGNRYISASYSPELANDLAEMGLDADKEMAKIMMYELGSL